MKRKAIKKLYVSLLGGMLFLTATGFLALRPSTDAVAIATEKITIDVDTLSYNENMLPKGVEGKTYPVFACTAVDGAGNAVENVDVVVYNPNGELVPINENRFSTTMVGKYKIAYRATKGAVEEKVELFVSVIEAGKYVAPYYTVNEDVVASSYTGEQVFLYDGEYGGGNGELNVSTEIEYDGSHTVEASEIENYGLCDYFIPTVEGMYTLKYTVTDIVGGTVTVNKEISVVDSLAPIMNQPTIVVVGAVGEEMSFAHTEATVYVEGMQIYVPVKVYVNDTEVTETMKYTPTSKGTYTVKYEAVNVFDAGNTAAIYQQEVQVFDKEENKQNQVPYLNNYLNLHGLEGSWRSQPESSDDKVEGMEYDVYLLTADGSDTNVSAKLNTAMPLEYANIKIGLESALTECSCLTFTYSDCKDSEKQITVTLKANVDATKADVWVNGVYRKTISVSAYSFCFEIDSTTGILTEKVSGSEICEITCYDSGKKFDGFEGGRVYLGLSMEGVANDFALKIYEVGTQNISGTISDNMKPMFTVSDDFSTTMNVEYGSSVKLQEAKAFDLYSAEVIVKATVIAPDKTKIFDGVITDASVITISQYGRYNLTYRAEDSVGNYREMKCAIMVTDRQSPVINSVSIPKTVKVGETFEFPTATVTDNATQQVVNWIYVTSQSNQKIIITDGKYTFENAGTYLVKYGAEDDAGNITVVTYTVVCK